MFGVFLSFLVHLHTNGHFILRIFVKRYLLPNKLKLFAQVRIIVLGFEERIIKLHMLNKIRCNFDEVFSVIHFSVVKKVLEDLGSSLLQFLFRLLFSCNRHIWVVLLQTSTLMNLFND